jgi:hypothetical protein
MAAQLWVTVPLAARSGTDKLVHESHRQPASEEGALSALVVGGGGTGDGDGDCVS